MMKALVMESAKHAVVKEMPYPSPGPNEITIQVKRVEICGTDIQEEWSKLYVFEH